VLRSNVKRETEGVYPHVVRSIIPMLCMQCANPACVAICPSGASQKLENGIVFIDKEVCLGCLACTIACPYSSRYLCDLSAGYFEEGLTVYEEVAYAKMTDNTVDKCDFCLSRAEAGEAPLPACVKACICEARIFGELEAIQKLAERDGATQLLPEEGTEPSVYYVPKNRA